MSFKKALFLHGFGANGLHWRPLIEQLDLPIEAITPDFPGHGNNPQILENFDQMLAFADGIMSQIQLPILLFGHSIGGFVAQHLAARYPDKVAGLILISSANQLFLHPELLEKLASAELSYDFIAAGFPVATPKELVERVYQDLLSIRLENVTAFSDEFLAPQLKPTYPVLTMGGNQDQIISPRRTRKLAKVLGSSLHVLEGVGHYPHLESTPSCASIVNEELGEYAVID